MIYEMLPVARKTKRKLKKIKEDVGNPKWDTIINDYVDILEESEVKERGDLAILKRKIMRWLDERKEE